MRMPVLVSLLGLIALLLVGPGCSVMKLSGDKPVDDTGPLVQSDLCVSLDGQSLVFAAQLRNVSSKVVTLGFGDGEQAYLTLLGPDGNEAAHWVIEAGPGPELLAPGDTIHFTRSLTLSDDTGRPRSPGVYRANVVFPAQLSFEGVECLPSEGELTASSSFELRRSYADHEDLIAIASVDSSIVIDLRYATDDNFVGQAVYPIGIAAVNKETGQRLAAANRIFQRDGYTIKVWDAYRPIHVQQLFWQACPDPRYVARPPEQRPNQALKPDHMNGMSVDVTLIDRDGQELPMPTEFDDFTAQAAADYPGASKEARDNALYLIAVMESVGFRNYPGEWWHFNDVMGTPTPYLDVPLEDLIQYELVTIP